MKVKVKYQAVSQRGKVVNFTETVEVPDFTPGKPFKFAGQWLSGATVESQINDYLNNMDIRDMMDRRDLASVLDWNVKPEGPKEPRPPKETVESILKALPISPEFMVELVAVYTRMKEPMAGLKPRRQVSILLAATGTAVEASGVAYRHMSDIWNGKYKRELPEGEHEPLLKLKTQYWQGAQKKESI